MWEVTTIITKDEIPTDVTDRQAAAHEKSDGSGGLRTRFSGGREEHRRILGGLGRSRGAPGRDPEHPPLSRTAV